MTLENSYLNNRYDKIATAWNGVAYEGTRCDHLIPKLIEKGQLQESDLIVLEVMSGTGNLTKELLAQFPGNSYACLDFSKEMLRLAPKDCFHINGSVQKIPLVSDTVDRVFLRSGLYDIPRTGQLLVLHEIKRVLTLGGLFTIQTYVTNDQTQHYLNRLVNLKDWHAGWAAAQALQMELEPFYKAEDPRYFVTENELAMMFSNIHGFKQIGDTLRFSGRIRYLLTNEMSTISQDHWLEYAQREIPRDIQRELEFSEEEGGLEFTFPGIIQTFEKVH